MRHLLPRAFLCAALLLANPPPSAAGEDEGGSTASAESVLRRMEGTPDGELFRASLELQNMGEKAVPALLQGLKDRSPRVRLGAARALIGLRQPEEAVKALVELAERADDRSLRKMAIELLGPTGGERAEAVLSKLLDETLEPEIKIPIAVALYRCSGEKRYEAKQVLKGYLDSDNFDVRAAGALALAALDDAESSRAVLAQLKEEPTERGRLAHAYLT